MHRNTVSLFITDADLGRYVHAVIEGYGYRASLHNQLNPDLENYDLRRSCAAVIIEMDSGKDDDFLKAFSHGVLGAQPTVVIYQKEATKEKMQLAAGVQVAFLKRPFIPRELSIKLQQMVTWETSSEDLFDLGGEYLLGEDKRIVKVREFVTKVSRTALTALVLGEKGTGKKSVARLIHSKALRPDKDFVEINDCAGSRSPLQSISFADEARRGLASDRKLGNLDWDRIGTLFLHEIVDLTFPLQARLLWLLERGELGRAELNDFGGLRIVAATKADPLALTQLGKFRKDLFYRLNVAQIIIPPLRDRLEDIPLLKEYFLEKYSLAYDKSYRGLSNRMMDLFFTYSWPGNVRELEETVQEIVLLGDESEVYADLHRRCKIDYGKNREHKKGPAGTRPQEILDPRRFLSLAQDGRISLKALGERYSEAVEAEVIRASLIKAHGNRRVCAEMLKMNYKVLLNKIREYNFAEIQ